MSEVREKDMVFFHTKERQEETISKNIMTGENTIEENTGDDGEVPRVKSVSEVPEEDRVEHLDDMIRNIFLLSKKCREVVGKGINSFEDLPRGKKEVGLENLFRDLGNKWSSFISYVDPFRETDDDLCTDQSIKEEIEKEMNHWKDLIDVCADKLETIDKTRDKYMAKVYAVVRKLKKIEDFEKVVDVLAIVDDEEEKEIVRSELKKYEAKDTEEIEDTEESFEDVMEKLKGVTSDYDDDSSIVSYLHKVLMLSRGISEDLGRMLTKF